MKHNNTPQPTWDVKYWIRRSRISSMFSLFLFSFTRVWTSFNAIVVSDSARSQHGKVISGCHKNDKHVHTLPSPMDWAITGIGRLHLKTDGANRPAAQKHSVCYGLECDRSTFSCALRSDWCVGILNSCCYCPITRALGRLAAVSKT